LTNKLGDSAPKQCLKTKKALANSPNNVPNFNETSSESFYEITIDNALVVAVIITSRYSGS